MSEYYFDFYEQDIDFIREELIKSLSIIPANPNKPVFLLLEQMNTFDEKERSDISAIEFTKENIDLIFDIIENPYVGWELYYSRRHSVGSDPISKLLSRMNRGSSEFPEVWIPLKIAIYDSSQDNLSKSKLRASVFKDFLDNLPSFTDYQRWRMGLFNGKINHAYQFHDGTPSYFEKYWKPIRDEPERRKDLCYSKQIIDEVLTPEEKMEIGQYPCVIYALKQCDIPEEIIRTIYNQKICYGNTIKTKALHEVLSSYKYRLRIYKISFKLTDKFSITNDIYPKVTKTKRDCDSWPIIELDFYRGHLMKHEEIDYTYVNKKGNEKTIKVPFLRLLHLAFEEKLIVPMNAYEYAELFENKCFSLNYKVNTKEILVGCDSGDIFNSDLVPFEGKNKQIPRRIIYADFECSVDELYHIPYCISFTEINSNDKIHHFWGRDCGKKFLDYVVNTLNELRHKEEENKSVNTFTHYWKKPMCVIYFHNLKYDFTFLLQYLQRVELTSKDNKLYAAKGRYGNGFNKMSLEFRDTYPLLQMTLKKAGESFLSEKKKLQIRKEVFPYELYTYTFFNKYPDGWAPLDQVQSYFNEDQYKEFILNLKKTLPFIPIIDDERRIIMYKSDMYLEEYLDDDECIMFFNYKEYCYFYCDQDVRVLAQVMKSYNKLMTSGEISGINGVPPFGQNYSPYKYLTISSLAYDYNLKSCVVEWKINENKWVPRYEYYQTKGLLRYIGHQTIRGGRVMTRDNVKWHYVADPSNPYSILVDYDGVSLYPSAIFRLWMTEGKPIMIKGSFSEKDFLEKFTHPDAPEGKFKEFNDGWIHVYSLMCWKDRHFPCLCIKNDKTKLNNYQNFHGAVDTWINAIDLFNLIEFQNATFYWDAAIVWRGARHYECRSMIKNLFDFRLHNKKHPIQLTTKLMMNSIYGKSALKPSNHVTYVIDKHSFTKSEEKGKKYDKRENWEEFFNANAYRIEEIAMLDDKHIQVKCHELDLSHNYVQFGSNVLAMARRIIERVMSLAEDMEELHPECAPGLFYTDTDSMHIRKDLLKYTEEAYLAKYGSSICGTDLCQFHIDFDPPKNFKKGEEVIGANESWFIMKKIYADQLIGTEGSIAYHQRMKGVPSDLVKWIDYEKIYNDEPVIFDLLEGSHVSFFYENGHVGSRRDMKRVISTKEGREQLKENLDKIKNFDKALDKISTPPLEDDALIEEPTSYQPSYSGHQEWMDGDTQPLPICEEVEKREREDTVIDILQEDDERMIPFKLPRV